ncbi:trifolitoxin immunity domain-containing protein [Actinokineospora fastidiosa]|uniref:Trifolitoxin immunity domain-containing protein n=1 Tax=Actinokineospora fastidiosa TaxID=1816 RepID=A0A918GKT3_9PSEU|nr:trifolitoxin immunity domain-containing protein [Actinokineospora fastidiosa]
MSESLPGGWINAVTRVGDTVRRPQQPRSAYVHRLLEHLAAQGWSGAPRFLGVDSENREILTYLPGQAVWRPEHQAVVRTGASLARVAALARELHDLTEGTPLAHGAAVVCHNDLSPRNTVYRNAAGGLEPFAFVDWDLAAPGERVHDIAHICWQYLDLGHAVIDVTEAARLIRTICDGYGAIDHGDVVDTILWWQDRSRRGIETGAAAGDPAMVRLRDNGTPARIAAAYGWLAEHRVELAELLG